MDKLRNQVKKELFIKVNKEDIKSIKNSFNIDGDLYIPKYGSDTIQILLDEFFD